LGGDELNGMLLDLEAHPVDIVVAVDHPAGSLVVQRLERSDGALDLLLHHASHEKDLFLQGVDLTVKSTTRPHRRLPMSSCPQHTPNWRAALRFFTKLLVG